MSSASEASQDMLNSRHDKDTDQSLPLQEVGRCGVTNIKEVEVDRLNIVLLVAAGRCLFPETLSGWIGSTPKRSDEDHSRFWSQNSSANMGGDQ